MQLPRQDAETPALGGARVGIREVAERAGVAISSVSRVISAHPDVSAGMRQRVLGAIAELGYQPDFLAKSLRTGSTMTVGIMVSDIRNLLMARIVYAAQARLRRDGYIALIINSLEGAGLDAGNLAMLDQRRVDGMMIAVRDEDDGAVIRHLAASQTPALLLDRDLPGLTDTSAVLFDHVEGVSQAVEHLIALGHRRIALVNGFPGVRPSRERARGLLGTCAAHRGTHPDIVPGWFTTEHGRAATIDLMVRRTRPTAIIAGGNQILAGVMQALQELRLAIPDEVSVVTCDDVPMAGFLSPRLATVRRDVDRMGEMAAELMLAAMAGSPPGVLTLPTAFDAAESCAAVPRRGAVCRPP